MSPSSDAAWKGNELRELLNVMIPADSEAIASVADTVAEILTRLEVPEQKRLEIRLALQEALANAVLHGCQNDKSKRITCRLQCDGKDRIAIIVTDPGPGFSPESIPDPKRN